MILNQRRLEIDLLNPYPWTLSSVPYSDAANIHSEASLTNTLIMERTGPTFLRGIIDGLFTRKIYQLSLII